MNIRDNISFLKTKGENVDEYEAELSSISTKLKENIQTQLFGPKAKDNSNQTSNHET